MISSTARRFVAVAGLGVSIAGCNSSVERVVGDCPKLELYSAEDQRRAAAEIRKNPNSELARLVRDYGKLRKACRVE